MEGIGFKNMKVFKDQQWFNFKDITLLTGTNNSGKSSIINAMQMLQENIKAKNIDELIRTEFKLTSNQNKYGSIANFVNNKANSEDNYFVFIRQIDSVEYRIKIDIYSGLESYGNVDSIMAFDIITKAEIFNLQINKPYPDYQCNFSINYKYFIDRFDNKCKNSEKLMMRIIELDKLKKEVNEGNKTVEEFKEFADKVSHEVAVYISSGEMIWSNFDDTDNSETKSFDYHISKDKSVIFDTNNQQVNEIGVFFVDEKDENGIGFNPRPISGEKYSSLFKPSFNNGIFDFTFLWENNPEIKMEFENLVCSYYKKEFNDSQKMLNDDLIILLSNSQWTMKEKYSDIDPMIAPQNLTKTFMDSLPDFGLIGSLLHVKIKSESGENYRSVIANNYIEAMHNFNEKREPMIQFRNATFFNEVYYKFSELLIKSYKSNKKRVNHKRLIAEPVFNEIYDDIIQKIFKLDLRLNNEYVSSSRFSSKRAYTFNDNTDFTNLLKQVENPKKNNKVNSKKFIDKWMKEFGIAEELLLKPDLETGNFKASLRIGNKETQLADFGLGTNQLLPIIFSLAIHSYGYIKSVYEEELFPRTVVIEEPEANLHPALQSKLADMFVDANAKFGVQIIAETHSEYLIRRMQYLVAKDSLLVEKGDLSIANTNTNIYYINSELDEHHRKAYEINFKNNGQLTESFGKGFIDETTNLQFELYKLNNAQSN